MTADFTFRYGKGEKREATIRAAESSLDLTQWVLTGDTVKNSWLISKDGTVVKADQSLVNKWHSAENLRVYRFDGVDCIAMPKKGAPRMLETITDWMKSLEPGICECLFMCDCI